MNWQQYKMLYIHLPFCKKRCSYCNFTTCKINKNSSIVALYIDNLCKKIKQYKKQNVLSSIKTIYIGGGTPSYIKNTHLKKLFSTIEQSVCISNIEEFSIEGNPDSIDRKFLSLCKNYGVNRLSIGVQSLDDSVLATLGRVHTSSIALNSISLAFEHFKNVSVDLMCGIPNQSKNSFKNTLKKIVENNINHISIYPLYVEENTLIDKQIKSKVLNKVDDDIQADEMDFAFHFLSDNNYTHYEVASYAKDNFKCKHNLGYWLNIPYLGIGRSATTCKINNLSKVRITDNKIDDNLDEEEMLLEECILKMRTNIGIDNILYNKIMKFNSQFKDVIESLIDKNLIKMYKGSYIPTHKGMLLGNEIYLSIYNLKN